jgi:chromosome segregation protein
LHFTRLRLSGFKSFVDPTELRIEPGLTGVVGPNGCGKSNLLEALRWVMGENSAKSMRGSDMDDVIFAGTTKRPARNLAEVSLSIDNTDRRAPAAFNDEVELEVSRRIERDSGSAYRVNAKEVRARDVQLLFADAATGAHSPALVSQGRVSALIAAKPRDRRAILEEAAGISGLHSRRDEAERRLRAAEVNLVRLHDVMQQIESQLASLRRQAAQAKRYKKVSAEIRHLQALELYQQWKRVNALLFEGEATLRAAETKVADITATTSRLATEQAILATRLPDLRHSEAEAAASLHHLILARDGLAAEEQRLTETRAKLMSHLQDVGQDIAREKSIVADTDLALARITAEQQSLKLEIEGEADAQDIAALRLEEAAQLAGAAVAALDAAKTEAASASAQRNRYMQELDAANRRLSRLDQERVEIKDRLAALQDAPEFLSQLKETEEAIAVAEALVESCALAQEQAEQNHAAARAHEQALREKFETQRNSLARLTAERDTLAKILKSSASQTFTPLIDRLQVTPGYEAALGAALGDDLEAPVDEEAPAHWTTLPVYSAPQALPTGTTPLSQFVNAPAALARRLSQTGVMAGDISPSAAAQLAKALLPGQRLVTRTGALCRWDGFTVAADAPSPAAIRLAQRNRLLELEESCAQAEDQLAEAETAHIAARATVTAAASAEQDHRRIWREAEEKLSGAHKAHAQATARAADMKAKLAALEARAQEVARNLDEAQEQREIAASALDNLTADISMPEKVAHAQRAAEQARQASNEAHTAHENLALAARHRTHRLETLTQETKAWQLRRDSATKQIDALTERAETSRLELAEIEDRPNEIAQSRRRLGDQIELAEQARKQSADTLAAAEAELAGKDTELRRVQTNLSEAREERVRLATGLEQLAERRRDVTMKIAEDFDCVPQQLLAAVEEENPENLPAPEEIISRLDRLKAERERMGPVNLRAEVEVAEFEAQIATLQNECSDLENAIARLRQAIGGLNREGRERLLSAFEQVNSHFGTLFTTLFGGGHAHLELTESSDPLEAGLEIMASPPGKRLQVLSLLSGGEQALTALSLIFAVFMTNPAPICVLDEVDAPLDDANVERFCNLLDDMVNRTRTRFLIVTHNAVTMSRMNRLFGVTMAERGISQLVSVDLERVEGLRAAS